MDHVSSPSSLRQRRWKLLGWREEEINKNEDRVLGSGEGNNPSFLESPSKFGNMKVERACVTYFQDKAQGLSKTHSQILETVMEGQQ